MFLMVGLGNPGAEYARTRHNLGFMVIDAIKDRFMANDSYKEKFQGLTIKGSIGSTPVVLLKPQTYMNLSGKSVRAAAQFFKIPPNHIIVFHDDLDLALGKIRVKTGGGTAGHNGIKDIDQHIGVSYMRVRVGIQHPGEKARVSDYVLNSFSSEESTVITPIIQKISENCQLLLDDRPDYFMTRVTEGN